MRLDVDHFFVHEEVAGCQCGTVPVGGVSRDSGAFVVPGISIENVTRLTAHMART
jgi:hypothetical protein